MRSVTILSTGGTISMVSGEAALTAAQLVEGIPAVANYAVITHEELCRVGSSRMTTDIWLELAKRTNSILNGDQGPDAVVITHGTDTLEEAAYFLNLTIKSAKPVVLVGAMRSADEDSPDGYANLLDAVRVAVNEASIGLGVLVVFNEDIFAARDLTKSHNRRPDAFSIANMGRIGMVDPRGVRMMYKPLLPHTLATEFDVSNENSLPKVHILTDYAGFDPRQDSAPITDYDGIVIRSFAGGRVSPGMGEEIGQFTSAGLPVVLASRVPGGRIIDWPADSSGIVYSNGHSESKSQILLTLALTRTKEITELQRIFDTY